MQCPRCNTELRAFAGCEVLYRHTFTAPPTDSPLYPFPGAQVGYVAEPEVYLTALNYQCGSCGLIPVKYRLDVREAVRLGLTADRRSEERVQAILHAFMAA